MKKLLTFLALTAVLCFAVLTPVSAIELKTDERTGITYYIKYQTTISCSASGLDEGTHNRIQAFPGYQLYNLDTSPDSAEVLDGIAEMEAKITDKFDKLVSGSTGVAGRNLMDGFEYTSPEPADHYWRFFDLPRDFKGSTVITRDDVPFTVTVDEQGKISFKVVTDYIGEKYAEFYIPTEVSHTKTITETEKYYLDYPGFESGPYQTLDEVLDYCAKYNSLIDPNDPVRITLDYGYYSRFYVTTTRAYKLQVTYGNTPTYSSSNNETELSVNSTLSTSENATPDNENKAPVNSTFSNIESSATYKETDAQESSPFSSFESTTVSETDTTSSAVITDTSQISTTNVDNVASDKPAKISIIWIAITVAIFLGVAVSVVIILKHHKIK